MAKSKADWERIEQEYRAGQLSIREIAARNGISEGAIRKRAKRDGWKRDLTAKVSKAARDASVRAEVRNAYADSDGLDDDEVVERFAQRGAEVEQMQRGQVGRLMAVGDALLQELQATELCVTKRTGAFRDLAQAAGRLIPLQRAMYRLDEPEAQRPMEGVPTSKLEALLDRLD